MTMLLVSKCSEDNEDYYEMKSHFWFLPPSASFIHVESQMYSSKTVSNTLIEKRNF